jgi:hypothetical protein
VITIAKQYCPDCVDNCWFAHDRTTGQVVHVDDFPAYTMRLKQAGYYYVGHVAGEFRYKESYRLTAVTPLPTDWQMTFDACESMSVLKDDVDF